MGDTLRCAVIGAGAIGLNHMDSFKKHPKAELVGVAEVNADRRKEAADKYKLPIAVEDYKEILRDKSINVVSIALPNFLHASVSVEAINAGKHVMLDKPMATSAKEAQLIIDAWKERKVLFMVGQNFRFRPDTQIAREYIRNGELGEVYHGRAHWMRRSGIPRIGSWFTQKKLAGGGCCYDIGVHLLDCALHCMDNFDAESVSGIVQAKFGPRGKGDGSWGKSEVDASKPFDVEDLAAAMIKLKGGKSLILEVSWALHGDSGKDHGVDLYGTEGSVNLFPVKILKTKGTNYETITPEFKKLPTSDDRLVHFIDCILNKSEPLVRPEDSLKIQKILDAIYESSATGREVRLS
jgi:predicted dehydrogenase